MYLKSVWNAWTRSLKNRKARRCSRRHPAAPWSAEVLEARQLLSSITVTSMLDNLTASDGQITLREALLAANTNTSVDGSVAGESGVQDRIVFAGPLVGGMELDQALGTLVITDSVRIEGSGPAKIAIDARERCRVFDITAAAGNVTFAGIMITGGRTTADGLAGSGAGIRSASTGTLSLETVELMNNHTSGNTAHGAGLYSGGGTVSLLETTVAGNVAAGASAQGGGIYAAVGTVITTNSTLSGNTAAGGGGLFSQTADVNLRSTTVAGNIATDGDGLSLFDGSLALTNTIVANPNPDSTDGVIRFTNNSGTKTATADHSLISVNDGSSFAASPGGGVPDAQGNFIGTSAAVIDAELDVLAGNSGQTRTHALLFGSPAINSGSNAAVNALGLPYDQRGIGSARIDGTTVDMGAFEVHAANPVLVVTTANDELDADTSNPDDLSLREAIAIANARFGADTIVFDTGLDTVFSDSLNYHGAIFLTLGELAIRDTLTITGNGAYKTVIDTRGGSRALDALWGAINLTVNNLTINRGRVEGFLEGGAAIRFLSAGTLVVNKSQISNSGVFGDWTRGGAIFANPGNVYVQDSLLTGNGVTGNFSQAGGIFSHIGSVSVVNSTISGTGTQGSSVNGSAILTDSVTAAINLVNSTVTANINAGDASSRGAVVAVRGSMSLTNSIVAGNNVLGIGEIDVTFANFDGVATFSARNSIIGVNTDTPLAGTGGVVGANGNFVGTAGTPFNPQLNALADNGGWTRTHALQATSPARDAGNNNLANYPILPGQIYHRDAARLFADQRGSLFLRVVNGTVDIGASEYSTIESGFDRPLPLAGTYFDKFGIAYVVQAGDDLRLRDSSGGNPFAKVADTTHIEVQGFEGIGAEFDPQGGTLIFDDGNVWRRVPALNGFWMDDNGDQVRIGQLSTDLEVTLPGGARVAGVVNSSTQVTVNGVQGSLSRDNQRIEFTNGDVWDMLPDIRGPHADSDKGIGPDTIYQAGVPVKFVGDQGTVVNVHFIDFDTVAFDNGLFADIDRHNVLQMFNGSIADFSPISATGTNVEIGGIYDVSGSGSGTARIMQADGLLTIKENSLPKAEAHFVSATEVVNDQTNAHGTISGNTITWTNGKIYTRVPDVSGPHLDQAGNETRVDQLERDLIFTTSAGVVTHGQILSQTQFVETDGAQRTGTISGDVLTFSDSTVWTKLPDLRGNWIFGADGTPRRIEQAGASTQFFTGTATTFRGEFLSTNIIQTNVAQGGGGFVTGTVVVDTNGNQSINFSNGTSWQRPAPQALDAVFADPRDWPFV